jgi:tetratricopeptide (TPR) repeat protein
MPDNKKFGPFFVCLSFLFFLVFPCPAQEKTKDVLIGSSYLFTPKAIEGTLEVSVHLPEGYAESKERYPVLYLLDVETDFVFGSAVADFLGANNRIPNLIVVGVFLGKVSGAPPQLIEFLEKELFPFVETNYRVQPCRVLYGHSARSFAALYVLLNRPDLFYGYIGAGLGLTSPPFTTAIDLVKLSDSRLSAMTSLKKSFYFVLGNEQPFFPGVDQFIAILKSKAPKDLDWEYENMENDDHFSNKLKTLYNGLEHVFRGWYPIVESARKGPEAIKADYDRLSDRLGFAIGLPQNEIHRAVMNWLAYQGNVDLAISLVRGLKARFGFDSGVSEGDLMFAGGFAAGRSKFDDAVKIYSFLGEEYPDSARGFNALGEAYEKSGRPEPAIKNYEKAVRLAREKNDPALKKYLDNLERLKR